MQVAGPGVEPLDEDEFNAANEACSDGTIGMAVGRTPGHRGLTWLATADGVATLGIVGARARRGRRRRRRTASASRPRRASARRRRTTTAAPNTVAIGTPATCGAPRRSTEPWARHGGTARARRQRHPDRGCPQSGERRSSPAMPSSRSTGARCSRRSATAADVARPRTGRRRRRGRAPARVHARPPRLRRPTTASPSTRSGRAPRPRPSRRSRRTTARTTTARSTSASSWWCPAPCASTASAACPARRSARRHRGHRRRRRSSTSTSTSPTSSAVAVGDAVTSSCRPATPRSTARSPRSGRPRPPSDGGTTLPVDLTDRRDRSTCRTAYPSRCEVGDGRRPRACSPSPSRRCSPSPRAATPSRWSTARDDAPTCASTLGVFADDMVEIDGDVAAPATRWWCRDVGRRTHGASDAAARGGHQDTTPAHRR